jgi:hypothetical protein
MPSNNDPVMLELAHLPREQVGPFLLLGLNKDADKEQVEAKWAERLKWARKQQTNLTLEEINWARELISDPARRMTADATTLNPDTAQGGLTQIVRKYNTGPDDDALSSDFLDEEKELDRYEPAVEVPELEAVKSAIPVPEIPRQMPAAASLLAELAGQPLDPWEWAV